MNRTSLRQCLAFLLLAATVSAQGVAVGEKTVVTAVIDSIDPKTREITLKEDDGTMTTLVASDAIKRFSELKAGDRVTFHYLAAVLIELKPVDKPLSAPIRSETMTRKTAGAPAGIATRTETAVVAITAIDRRSGWIQVKTHDDKAMSFQVEDKAKLESIHGGDHIEITFSEALGIEVEPAAAKPAEKPAPTKDK